MIGISGEAPGGLHFEECIHVILMHTEVGKVHYVHCLGYFPAYCKHLLLDE